MTKREFGDWQTPVDLARAVMRVVAKDRPVPATVLEPTCGQGAFLLAAAEEFEDASLVGYEINEQYARDARANLPEERTRIIVADFFTVDWERALAALPEPVLVTGNPPWVTNATLGGIGSTNLPHKRNFKGLSGFDARTGKSNFDVSEWMLLRLLEALQGRRVTLAMLCKTAVARRVLEFAAKKRWQARPGGIWQIDARRNFDAAVDAALLVCEVGTERTSATRWPVYPALDAPSPSSAMVVSDGSLIADAEALERTAHLIGTAVPEWRSGLKHDCARVMELERRGNGWANGLGEAVEIEDHLVFPLLKSSAVANGSARKERAVVVPQKAIGEDTAMLRQSAPRLWRYLSAHRQLLAARKSSIYRGQPEFAIFGIGPYSFAPWKVAISGLYKRSEFKLVAPQHDKPVMLDDTCYFIPFATEHEAVTACDALRSPLAQDFLKAHIFWDAKRPINKALLQKLDLDALLDAMKSAATPAPDSPAYRFARDAQP